LIPIADAETHPSFYILEAEGKPNDPRISRSRAKTILEKPEVFEGSNWLTAATLVATMLVPFPPRYGASIFTANEPNTAGWFDPGIYQQHFVAKVL
jgi:hypothetical protein